MMVRKTPVNGGEKQVMLPGEAPDKRLDDSTSSAVPGIPADAESPPLEPFDQTIYVPVEYREIFDRARTDFPITSFGEKSDPLDVGSKKWRMTKDHFEAIILGGIMAASYLYSAINAVQYCLSKIEHWRWP